MNISIRSFAKWAGSMLGSLFAITAGIQAQQVVAPIPNDSAPTNVQDVASYKKMSLEELLDQQVTSVSKQPQTYAQAPAAIEVITGDAINRSGASSIPEALRLADNLDVAQTGSASWNISARGFNASPGDKLLVLMDGRTIYGPLFSGVIWDMQDYLLADLDRIEVISGPGGTLWGANAVNGVINITSKSARDTQGLYVEGGGGSWLKDFGAVRYGGTLATNVYYRIYGKYFERGPEDYPDGTSAHDSWNRGAGGFRIDADPNGQDVFTLQGDLYASDVDGPPLGAALDSPSAYGNASGANVLGRWTHTFAEDSDMSLQMYYDRTHLDSPTANLGATIPAGTLKDSLNTADIDFQDRFALGRWNNIVWGLGYRFSREVDQNAPLVAFIPGPLDRNLYNVFLQDQIKLGDPLVLTLGTKLEHNDYTGFEFEPNARLQWNVTDKQMVWGAISRAVRTPSRYDQALFEPNPANAASFLGSSNADFDSETVIAYELGYRAQLLRQVSVSVSSFYNDYNNLRSVAFNATPGQPPLYFANGLRGDTFGFELSSDYQMLDWWRWHAGWDLLEENIYQRHGQVDLDNALDQTADPRNQVFLRASLDLPGHLELDPAFRWIDTLRTGNGGTPVTVPGYAEMDVRLAWHVTTNVEISVVGQNLLHDRHAEGIGTTPEQIQRNIFGEITCRF